MNAENRPAGVVVFLVWRKKIHLILRDDKPNISNPNTWHPVSGGIEDGENFWECARRELEEETGFIPRDLTMLGVSLKGNAYLYAHLTDSEREQVVLGEGQCFDFFSFEALSALPIKGAFGVYLSRYSLIIQQMIESGKPPRGSDLGLAVWNGQ